MADKPTKTEGADETEKVKPPQLFRVLKPITYQGEINETTVDQLIRGARFDAARVGIAAKLTDRKELVDWYKANSNHVTYPTLPPILLPFDHLTESAQALLIKRGVIATK